MKSASEEHDEKRQNNPSYWCISYEQLLDLDDLALMTCGEEAYSKHATMRDICQKIIIPRCRESGTSFALSLNPNGLGGSEDGFAFITHSWDGLFASFVESLRYIFQTAIQKPNLWICAFALNQVALSQQLFPEADVSLEEFPFVRALRDATSFCVVRNSNTDLYSRIWCVCGE